MTDARTQFIGIEHLTEGQIELVRKALERHAAQERKELAQKRKSGAGTGARGKSAEDTVDRLLDRF